MILSDRRLRRSVPSSARHCGTTLRVVNHDAERRATMAHRPGITLVELIVVIAIVAGLSAIVVAFYPGVQEQERSARAAVMFEGWLRQAKSQAMRDQSVAGLRLLLNSNSVNMYYCTQCQFLEQPPDFFIPQSSISSLTGTTITFTPGVDPETLAAVTLDFFNGQGVSNSALWAVQPGDHLAVNGQVYVVVNALPSAANNAISNILQIQPTVNATLSQPVAANATTISLNMSTIAGLAANNPAGLSVGCYLDIMDPSGTVVTDTVLVQSPLLVSGGIVQATVLNMTAGHPANVQVQAHGIVAPAGAAATLGYSYRVIRSPRVKGKILQLPENIVIDLSLNQNFDNAFNDLPSNYALYNNWLPVTMDSSNAPMYFDVLFSPSGTVVTPGVASNFLALWVRDLSPKLVSGASVYATPYQFGPTILAVYVNSGLIAAHPVNDSGVNPYTFLMDGRSQ